MVVAISTDELKEHNKHAQKCKFCDLFRSEMDKLIHEALLEGRLERKVIRNGRKN